MNVTKANFPQVAKELAALLPTASFVAIDEEMTGIHLPGVFVERMADSTEERYAKMKSVAEHYKIIQIGLCLFHEIPPAAGEAATAIPKFEARPYNFYLFPEEGAVNMEASAIAFNKTHGMNFNKWIYEGIPYLHEEAHQALIQKFYGSGEGWTKEQIRVGKLQPTAAAAASASMDESSSSSAALPQQEKEKRKRTIVLEKEADLAYLAEVQGRIWAWLGSRPQDQHELLLPEANSFLRLAVMQWLEGAAPESFAAKGVDKANLFLESRSVGDQKWKVAFYLTHFTPEEKAAQDALALTKKRADFDAKVGFKLIWDMLREARAPLVVHNGFFDVLFMFSHFESGTLPATLPEFKQALGKLFPAGVFDTKFLSNSRQFAFPHEFMSKRVAAASAGEVTLSQGEQARVEAFKNLNLSEAALTTTRFRETHLEKLYLVLKQEQAARITVANGASVAASSSTPAAPVAVPAASAPAASGNGNGGGRAPAVASPPPALSEVSIALASGFDKYALVGQPGGDDSAAHEAGYDAWMTAVIFASFASEAPPAEILAPLRANRSAGCTSVSASATAMQSSPWSNRIPLFRHLMALDLNVDPATGMPRADSLVDQSSCIYLLKGFPAEWKTEDILRMFEGQYTCAKRKMGEGDESKSDSAAAAADVNMTDASSASSPLPVIVTAAPKLIWIDDASLFLSIPKTDAAKMDAFLRANAAGANTALIPESISITKFALSAEEQAAKDAENAAAAATAAATAAAVAE